ADWEQAYSLALELSHTGPRRCVGGTPGTLHGECRRDASRGTTRPRDHRRPDPADSTERGTLMGLTTKREAKKAKKQADRTASAAGSSATQADQAVRELQKLASQVGPVVSEGARE